MSTQFRGAEKEVKELLEKVEFSYPLLAPNLGAMKSHNVKDADKITFTVVDLDKDSVTPSLMHPEMTEINHISAGTKSFSFRPYLLGLNYRISNMQDGGDTSGVISTAVRELSIMFDTQTILGTRLNQGLISSNSINNPFYVTLSEDTTLRDASTVDAKIAALKKLFTAIEDEFASKNSARSIDIYYWGDSLTELFNANNVATDATILSVARQVFTIPVTFIKLPKLAMQDKYIKASKSNALPAKNGMVAVDPSSIRVDYVQLPAPIGSGNNEEHDYTWYKMRTGSVSVLPVREAGIVMQPCKFDRD